MVPIVPFKLTNAKHPIITPTYEGSGRTVHPDILIFANGFKGQKYVLSIDPYPYADDRIENPSVLVSNIMDHFSQNIGSEIIPNPISGIPPQGWFYSDSEIVFCSDFFYLFWRAGHLKDFYRELHFRKSVDLINWSEKKVMPLSSGKAHRYCSPAFISEGDFFSIFMCDATDKSLYLFEANAEGPLLLKERCDFKLPIRRQLWHIDAVKLSNGEYWALACDTQGDLWFAKSENRIKWDNYNLVLQPTERSWDSAKIYRSTFAVYDGKILVWYSACNEKNAWYCGYTESNISGLDRDVYSGNVLKV